MKRKSRILILTTALTIFLFAHMQSCMPEPEEPRPAIEEVIENFSRQLAFIAQWQTYDFTRFQFVWMQQLAGVRDVPRLADRYEPQPLHFNDSWSVFYLYILYPLKQIEQITLDAGASGYLGITRILQAYSLGLVTDAWGDIPYFGVDIVQGHQHKPVYDKQENLIEEIISLIDQGIASLRQAGTGLTESPGPEQDMIYRGNPDLWVKAANVLRLRYLMRLAHYNNDYSGLPLRLTELDLFTGNEDNMLFPFERLPGLNNIYYDYETIIRNTRVGKFFTDLLKSTNDPRLPVLVKQNSVNEYTGSAPGESNLNASHIGSSLASINSPLVMISYAEQKFIEAEIHLRNQRQALADEAFRQGVVASLDFHGTRNAGWENANANIQNVSLRQIITAKYVALFLQPEVWADYRRTGYPAITPFEPNTHVIPRRMLYPANEFETNPENIPANITLFDRVWWDRE